MKKQKYFEFDREKKIHRVEKGNKVAKYKNSIYNYEDDDEELGDESDLYEVEVKHTD